MPMTRSEPYRPLRPTIRELMEGRPARADDGGIPPKGYLGRPPKSAYRTEDRAQAWRRLRAREIQPWRGESGAHTVEESSSKGTGERQATGEGRGGERREGGVEWRVTRGRGAHLAWPGTAKGNAPRGREDQRREQRGAVTR